MSHASILLTGANGGIGTSIIHALSARNYRVFAGVRTKASLQALASKHDPELVVPLLLDVTDEQQMKDAIEIVRDATGTRGLAGLVNNAGLIVQGPIELLSSKDLREQFTVNVFGPMTLVRLSLELLRPVRGRIVNIGAATGRLSVPMLGAIASSKAALASLNDALRMELKPWDIRVSLIEPGAMTTPIFARAAERAEAMFAESDPATYALYAAGLAGFAEAGAKQKTSSPDIVAKAVVHALTAARPRNRYLTGSDAQLLNILKNLPDGLRDGMLRSSLGLNPKARAAEPQTVAVRTTRSK